MLSDDVSAATGAGKVVGSRQTRPGAGDTATRPLPPGGPSAAPDHARDHTSDDAPDRTGAGRPESPGNRWSELDGLRAVAVALVFAYHVVIVAPPLHRWVLPGGLALDAGVELFFVLSGFLIYSPFARAHLAGDPAPGIAAYARRRALRIYPAYLVAFGVLWAVGWIAVGGPGELAGHLTLTHTYQGLSGPDTGIEPAWTLCVEVTFYAFVPLWAALVRRAGPVRRRGRPVRPVVAEVAGAATLMAVGIGASWWAAFGSLPRPVEVLAPNLPALAGGMMLGIVAAARPGRPRLDRLARLVPPVLVCWPLAVVALLWMPGRPTRWPVEPGPWLVAHLTQAAFGLLLAAPVMLGRGTAGLTGRVLRARPLAWVGVVSYGVYLWHYDLLFHVRPGLLARDTTGAVAGTAGILALALALGALSHHLLERPAVALARRRP